MKEEIAKVVGKAVKLAERRFTREFSKNIEKFWGDAVLNARASHTSKKKKYIVAMFPYPSGSLHMGHVRVYTISDCLARYHAITGCRVIHPIGWDAFGLPAENAAKERNLDPEVWTKGNIETMRNQLLNLGCNFDWNREISTCDPRYYRWTQWLFLKLYDAGLVRQKRSEVNWDPVDKTVLANEQIDVEGRSWRSGAPAEKKILNQWFVRITRYARDLWDGLDNLNQWDDIVQIQRNWIGNCDSYIFHLPLISQNGERLSEILDLCLDHPKDLLHAKCVRIQPNNLLCSMSESRAKDSQKLLISAWNPILESHMPILISNFESCAGRSNVKLEVDKSIAPECLVDENEILQAALNNKWGGYKGSKKLEDWVVSRQKYWGTPIPMVHCPNCKIVPVPVNDLPVELPKLANIGAMIGNPLESAEEWKQTKCPKCGCSAVRETDTLDTFFDSAWYFLRYLDPSNQNKIFELDIANQWMPVDIYVGGKEHAALHLFFARFVTHFLHNEGLLKEKEPFFRLLPQGIVRSKTFQIVSTKHFISADQVGFDDKGNCYDISTGENVEASWQKMSKSRHNGVNPLDMLERFGIDMTRLVTISGVSPQSDRNWDPEAYRGIENWLNRVLWIVDKYSEKRCMEAERKLTINPKLETTLKENYNYFIRLVSYHIEKTFLFNVAISRMQGLTNTLRKVPEKLIGGSPEFERCLHSLIIMLHVFAPHLSAHLWHDLQSIPPLRARLWKKRKNVWLQDWPILDADAEFDLLVISEDTVIDSIRIDRRQLEKMDCDSALKFVRTKLGEQRKSKKKLPPGVPDFKFILTDDSIPFSATLDVIENFGATLKLSLCEVDH